MSLEIVVWCLQSIESVTQNGKIVSEYALRGDLRY